MHAHEKLIRTFYEAFARHDYLTMQGLYHPEARFTDPVFRNLTASEAKAMWAMLITGAHDLEIAFDHVWADEQEGGCRWEARYTFPGTRRHVHNRITAKFQFHDGLIFRHVDKFNFWRWSRMAVGPVGLLFGWSPFLKDAIRKSVRRRLAWYMEKNPSAGADKRS